MKNPRIEINLNKVKHNTAEIVKRCNKFNINVAGVTKVFCGNIDIAKSMVEGGVQFLADSRLENIIGMCDIEIPKILLRLPMLSEIEEVIRYADYSLNSEVEIIEKLSFESIKQGKKHKIILMIDLGDLREGVWYENVYEVVDSIAALSGIELAGIGTNLTCYGGVIPSRENLSLLSNIASNIRKTYNIKLPIVSGGNSSSLHLLEKNDMPQGINNLRIGEAIVLGRETAFGDLIDGLYDDAFMLYGEIVEIKKKPSLPIGDIGMDAFGGVPTFIDKGDIYRAIVAVGRQDINLEGMTPVDSSIQIIGASSDHLILDVTGNKDNYKVGSEVPFKISYGCLLQAMTSAYVKKVFIND